MSYLGSLMAREQKVRGVVAFLVRNTRHLVRTWQLENFLVPEPQLILRVSPSKGGSMRYGHGVSVRRRFWRTQVEG
jgi:hypothetical protein